MARIWLCDGDLIKDAPKSRPGRRDGPPTAFDRAKTTLSTSFNSEVSQEVVRRLLDHTSHTMTAHYARLADVTIRDQWQRAQKINIRGEPVELPDDGPLADAAWMKQNLARAKMALPNGYCGLPLQKSCPHANAPLTELVPEFRQVAGVPRGNVASLPAWLNRESGAGTCRVWLSVGPDGWNAPVTSASLTV